MPIRRAVGKVSNSNPVEGIKNLIASMDNIDPAEVTIHQDLIDRINEKIDEKIKIREIISSFYDQLEKQNTKDSNKKILELIDLGKFIYYSMQEQHIKIIECGERPDFVIELNGEQIGIEHTGIYDDSVVAEISDLRKLFKKCEEKIKNERENITGLFNISIDPTKVKGNLQSSNINLIQIICESVIAKFENTENNEADCISSLLLTNHATLEITLEESYWLKQLDGDAISNSIKKKEKKIEEYKKLKNISQCWLLIVIEGASKKSSFQIDLNTLPTERSLFEKIFIFDVFKGSIIESK